MLSLTKASEQLKNCNQSLQLERKLGQGKDVLEQHKKELNF